MFSILSKIVTAESLSNILDVISDSFILSPTSNHFRNTLVFSFKRCQKLTITAFQVVLVVKNPPANGGNSRDVGLIPRSGRSCGGGHGNPLQYSFLENPMDRGVWQAMLHRVAKSQTQLKQLSVQTSSVPRLGSSHVP